MYVCMHVRMISRISDGQFQEDLNDDVIEATRAVLERAVAAVGSHPSEV